MSTDPKRTLAMAALLLPLLVAGCATQLPYTPAPQGFPATWASSGAGAPIVIEEVGAAGDDAWWTALGDPAIDVLVPKAIADSPTLAQAVSRMDEARAALGSTSARRLPSIDVDVNAQRARDARSSPPMSTSSAAGVGFSWEFDLFGRIKQSVDAANRRLDARTTDARAARLALAAQVARGVIGLRACLFSQQAQALDIASRTSDVERIRLRLSVGAAAAVEEARGVNGLAGARTRAAAQREECEREVHALTMLSGLDGATIRQQVAAETLAGGQTATAEVFMPLAPVMSLALPATVIVAHPGVVAADREAAAAWAEIGVARAERLPRLDLGGLFAGNWLRTGGSALSFGTGSLTAALTGPLFDGGAGAANVSSAEARYRSAEAALRQAARLAARDVEDALTGSASAQQRRGTAKESLDAARVALRATHAQWEAGAVSLFELEDARRQASSAQDAAIAAARDSVQAWIALVEASGNTAVVTASHPINR